MNMNTNIPTNLQSRYDLFCVKSAVKPQPTNQHESALASQVAWHRNKHMIDFTVVFVACSISTSTTYKLIFAECDIFLEEFLHASNSYHRNLKMTHPDFEN